MYVFASVCEYLRVTVCVCVYRMALCRIFGLANTVQYTTALDILELIPFGVIVNLRIGESILKYVLPFGYYEQQKNAVILQIYAFYGPLSLVAVAAAAAVAATAAIVMPIDIIFHIYFFI